MQLLAIVIFVIVCYCAIRDFKRTVLIWMPVQFLFNSMIALRYYSPGVALNIGMNIALFCIYFVKCRGKERKMNMNTDDFLFFPLLCLQLVSFFFSMLTAIVPFSAGLTASIKFFVTNFATLYLYQKVLNDEKDIRLFVRTSLVVIFMITLLGVYESVMHDNPWLDIVYLYSPHDESTHGRMWYTPPFVSRAGDVRIRYGMVRAYSFMGIHIAFGVACLFFLYMILTILKNGWNFGVKKNTLVIAAILLVAGIFCANSKTGMVGLVFLLLGFVKTKYLINPKIFVPFFLVVIAIIVFMPDYLNNYISLFDESVAEEGGGSTIALRENQAKVAMKLFYMNPAFGNGMGSIDIMKQVGTNSDILGAESAYLRILPERGILGIVVYLLGYLIYFNVMRRYVPAKEAFFFLLSLFVMEAATGLMDTSWYGAIVLAVRRCYQLSKNRKILDRVQTTD